MWSEVVDRLRSGHDEKQRIEILKRLLADAASQLGGGSLTVHTNGADHELVTEALPELAEYLGQTQGVDSLELAKETVPVMGGVLVERQGSSRLVDNTFDERLSLVRRNLRDEVFRLLSPEEG